MKKLIVLAASRLFTGGNPMKITRRFAVASLLAIAVAIVLGAPAPASAGKVKAPQVKLYPTADSPSRHATGTVAVYYDSYPGFDRVTVSVSKLAPNASYYMQVTMVFNSVVIFSVPIQTDASGNGQGWWTGQFIGYSITAYSFQVYDASGTLVLTSSR